jgi:hypothetical protein
VATGYMTLLFRVNEVSPGKATQMPQGSPIRQAYLPRLALRDVGVTGVRGWLGMFDSALNERTTTMHYPNEPV